MGLWYTHGYNPNLIIFSQDMSIGFGLQRVDSIARAIVVPVVSIVVPSRFLVNLGPLIIRLGFEGH